MPSANDFFAQLQGINTWLDQANSKLAAIKTSTDAVKDSTDAVKDSTDAVKDAVKEVNATLATGFGQLVTLGVYTNKALYHNAQQNDTIICLLEHISKNTCELLNEAHIQTGLQTSMKESTAALADLYASTHAEAALARHRSEELRKQIEECCPPPEEPPICRYERCPTPPSLVEPPRVEQPGRVKEPK